MKKNPLKSSFRLRRAIRKLHEAIQEEVVEDTPTMAVMKARRPEELEKMKKYMKDNWGIEVGT